MMIDGVSTLIICLLFGTSNYLSILKPHFKNANLGETSKYLMIIAFISGKVVVMNNNEVDIYNQELMSHVYIRGHI